jgi:hypothetical protein
MKNTDIINVRVMLWQWAGEKGHVIEEAKALRRP